MPTWNAGGVGGGAGVQAGKPPRIKCEQWPHMVKHSDSIEPSRLNQKVSSISLPGGAGTAEIEMEPTFWVVFGRCF